MRNVGSDRATNQVMARRHRFILSVVLATLIFLLSLGFLAKQNVTLGDDGPHAVNGVLDLSHVDLLTSRPLDLNGEWEFYPEVFLLDFDDQAHLRQTVTVPAAWDCSKSTSHEAKGYGTYRLIIRVKDDGHYSYKTSTIRAAAKIFVNGDEMNTMGVLGTSFEAEYPESRYMEGSLHTKDKEAEFVIHVSNFHYDNGGILKPFVFGRTDAVRRMIRQSRAFETVVTMMFLLSGALFLFIYFGRTKSKGNLYFGLASISMGLYMSTMNYQVISLFIPYNFFTRSLLQSLLFFTTVLFFLLFTKSFFSEFFKRNIGNALIFLNSLSFALILLSLLNMRSPEAMSTFNPISYLFLFSTVCHVAYIGYVLVRAAMADREDAGLVLIASVSFISYWISMLIKIMFEWELAYANDVLLLFTLITLMATIFGRMQREYVYATELTRERLENEFKYFFSQISPHFLHNTLNTIIALSYDDTEKAREALTHLSVYFRGKMDLHLQSGLIPLDDEIDMVTSYLEIEKMRFGDRLTIVYDIDPDLDVKIPPLTLQPLAENAVKHGVFQNAESGLIRISAKRIAPDTVHLTIWDSGSGIPEDRLQKILRGESDRLGLLNVIRKLELVEHASLDFFQEEDGFSVRITLVTSR